ncbi:MAG: DUF1080 domain-containing protein [Phycisphaeraceae bacterium]
MRKSVLTALFLLPLIAVSAVLADNHEKDRDTNAGEDDGFVALYNGKDLAGWKTEGNWVPQDDGVLAIIPRKGEHGWKRYKSYLYTEKQYENYVLELEYKHGKGGNSGLHFRIAAPDDWNDIDPVAKGIECQILDSHGKPDNKMGHHDCGGIIRTQGPSKNMAKPAGEWNKMVLTCNGQNIQVELNGEQIIDIQQDQGAMKDRPLKGYIALQDHGQEMWFRNIRIKELD